MNNNSVCSTGPDKNISDNREEVDAVENDDSGARSPNKLDDNSFGDDNVILGSPVSDDD